MSNYARFYRFYDPEQFRPQRSGGGSSGGIIFLEIDKTHSETLTCH